MPCSKCTCYRNKKDVFPGMTRKHPVDTRTTWEKFVSWFYAFKGGK